MPKSSEQTTNSEILYKKANTEKNKNNTLNTNISNEIEIILPTHTSESIINQLINSFELSIYKKQINNLSLNINLYSDLSDLKNILDLKANSGKVFIGTLKNEDSELVNSYCNKGILFFSFASDISLSRKCTFLINFFPKDDLEALFDFFPEESKIALLYPENYYGYNINKIIDPIASESKSIIINRASYKEDLSNAREAIKELGQYELRKYELERQKRILEQKDDDESKKALKKIKKFETLGNVEFTHLILPDYSIRLLEIAPLLPFYDVDPNTVQFVGTGVWDDKVFFDEPALQGAIFSGIEEKNRQDFFEDYMYIYKEKPLRISTIPYDLLGIITYIVDNEMKINSIYNFLNNGKIKFDGIDGKFYFKNNIIHRELNILKITGGVAKKIN